MIQARPTDAAVEGSLAAALAPAHHGASVRVLAPEEWGRLANLPIAEGGLPDPAFTTIVVAESAEGEIVGVFAAQTIVLLDGLWVAPAARRTRVLWQLFTGMRAVLLELKIAHSFAIVETIEVLSLAARVGFERLRGDLCRLDLSRVLKGDQP